MMRRIWRILLNTSIGFYEDGCSIRAAALTYFTMMSIVPVLAVALGLARGFGFAPILEDVIKDQLREQPEVALYVINFAYSLLENTSSGVIAGVGLPILLWSVYNILGSIEEALNNIWKVSNPRSWIRKITDYITAIIICPLFFVVSSSITIYLKTHFTDIWKGVVFLEYALIHLFPYLLTWMLFTFLYFFLPNRRIPFRYGIIGVLVGGTAYQLLQTFYISIQLKLTSYGAIYGSFAALPLFLIWLNLSWMIVLAGAELAYHSEISAWKYPPAAGHIPQSTTSERVLAVLVVNTIIQSFRQGKEPMTLHQLSDKLGASKNDLDNVIKTLVRYNILSETSYHSDNEVHYQPARDVSSLTLKTVVELFPPQDFNDIHVYNNPSLSYFEKKLKHYEQAACSEKDNITLGLE